MRLSDALFFATFPIRVMVVTVGAGLFVAVCGAALVIGFVTLPVWFPVRVYFTEYRHADERARRAYAELATTVMLESNQDPRKRQRGQWWG